METAIEPVCGFKDQGRERRKLIPLLVSGGVKCILRTASEEE